MPFASFLALNIFCTMNWIYHLLMTTVEVSEIYLTYDVNLLCKYKHFHNFCGRFTINYVCTHRLQTHLQHSFLLYVIHHKNKILHLVLKSWEWLNKLHLRCCSASFHLYMCCPAWVTNQANIFCLSDWCSRRYKLIHSIWYQWHCHTVKSQYRPK